jgi:hypothetical protein
LRGGVHIHADVLAEFLQHLKDCCQLLFRKHANLKIQGSPDFPWKVAALA